ncbi:MAG: hypothetical protein LQ344_003013 [Seirophora lacunosa]|nr:MAG: hypothetical protein LQ344_003013 [Seirophora lacunosa]
MANTPQGHPSHMRPPTPPKDKDKTEDTARLPVDLTYQGTLGQHILLDTPEGSPSSSSEYFHGSGGKLPKRVVFSPWTSYHKPPVSHCKTTAMDGTLRSLPPSKECVASHKSILKISTHKSSPLFDISQQLVLDPSEPVAVLLQSLSQHLSSASRDSRLDSYRTLLGCLSSYKEVPDTQLLVENLAGFLEYIRRDVLSKKTESGLPDVELSSHALKVLTPILYNPGLADAVPQEFAAFIAELAVSSMESLDTPKALLDHYMQLLARQKLGQKIINPERANRILNALNGLETRVKGNRVVGLKLMIYQRLLVQAKSLMIPRAEDWLEFLISSMSSSIKDIRSRAIAFGTDAALALGTTSAVSQSWIEILDRDHPSGPRIVDRLGARLLELLNVKDGGLHVPQIWSIVILFLRNRRHRFERWKHLQGWFAIMERAFNSSDAKVKFQANVAWNRFVSVLSLDGTTNASIIKVLRKPIASQLERKDNDNHMKYAKQIARSSYCNLLYYAFRPGATHEQLDIYWDAFVSPILVNRHSATKSDFEFSCEVLGALLNSSQPRVWDHNRAHRLLQMKPEELPCLDPKWIRHRVAKIVSILDNLRSHPQLAQCGNIRASVFFKVWQSFVEALGAAASKEVKVSMATMNAIAHIMTMLNRYWTSQGISGRLDVFVALIDEAVAKIGFRPFAEKRLLQASSESSFEAAETPSGRSSHSYGSMKSPITHVLDALVNFVGLDGPATANHQAIQGFLELALRSASCRRTRLAILWELAHDVISGRSQNVALRLFFWRCLAEETAQALSEPQVKVRDDGSPQNLGNDYRAAVRLLELGIQEFGHDIYPSWKTLSDALIDKIQQETGYAGILLEYTEPLSKSMRDEGLRKVSNDHLRCGTHILNHVRKMWEIIIDTIKTGAKPESSSLAFISDLLAAGFRSRHKTFVNDLIDAWNQSFGKAKALEYPATLHHALARIRLNTEVDLPGFVNDETTEIMSSPFNFIESQDEAVDLEPKLELSETRRSRGQEPARIHSQIRDVDFPSSPVVKGARPIQFAAVDSSPVVASVVESQHLTEHQKEVKERQEKGAAAMFPEIRSSPRRPRSAERPPELVLHRKQGVGQTFDADVEPSPTFPPDNTFLTVYHGFSPTPRSSRKPSIEYNANSDLAPSPCAQTQNVVERKLPAPRKASVEETDDLNLAASAPGVSHVSGVDAALPNTQDIHDGSTSDTTRSIEQRTVETAVELMSDPEEFADAPAHPLGKKDIELSTHDERVTNVMANTDYSATAIAEPLSTPRTMSTGQSEAVVRHCPGGDEVAGVVDSSASAPMTPSQDQQARAQLLRDLEEASSQGDSRVSKRRSSSSTPSKVGKKRKTQPSDSIKRGKPPVPFQICEVLVEQRHPYESNEEFVIIDDRPAAGQRCSASPAIKQGRSPSPTGNPHSSSVKTPAPKKVSERRRTRSMTDRQSLRSSESSAQPDPVETDPGRGDSTTTERQPRKRRRVENPMEVEDVDEETQNQVMSSGQRDVRCALPAPVSPTERQTFSPRQDEDDSMTSSQVEGIKASLLDPCEARPDVREAGQHGPSKYSDTVPNTPDDSTQPAARSAGQQMLDRFMRLLDDIKQVTFWPEEERRMVEVACDVVKNVHESGRKNDRRVT